MNTHFSILKKLKRPAIVLLLLGFLLPANAREIKILAIGNSFSENAIEQNLYQMAEANGDTLIIGNVYIPGCTINKHWTNAQENTAKYQYRKILEGKKTNTRNKTLLECIQDEEWDYISFQQGSYDSGKLSTYSNLPLLMGYVAKNVRNANVKYAFHATWAYAQSTKHSKFKNYNSDQIYMYKSIIDAVRKTGKMINKDTSNPNKIEFVIPSGTAIQNGRDSSIGDQFCVSDGYHLNALGKYTAACVWLEMITGKSAINNFYKPTGISDQQMRIAQKSAHKAVLNPNKVTLRR